MPGLDTALVVRTAVAHGRRRGFAVALGVSTGILIWGAAAAVGVSELLVTSRVAYDAVRLAGAVYLVWLGAAMLWRTWRGSRAGSDSAAGRSPSAVPRGGAVQSWFRGVTTNLLNPKIGVFYVAMLPQFIPAGAPHLLMGLTLAGVHDAEGIAWFTLLISAAHMARRVLANGRAHTIVDRITGIVLVGFGLRLAFSQR